MSSNNSSAPRVSPTAVGFTLVLASWVADAILDAAFRGDSFAHQLLHPTSEEVTMRTLFMGIQLGFILYIRRLITRNRHREEQLAHELLRAELEQSRTRAIVDAIGDAISIQDQEMKILYQNRAHIDFMGDHHGEYCYTAYHHRDSICDGCHLDRSYRTGVSQRREVLTQTKDGARFMEIISTPLRDAEGRIVAGIEAVRDITERKQVELEVNKLNVELELRAHKLSVANAELEAFNYSLSHDLRSYITRISTAQQMLESMASESPDAAFLVRTLGDSCHGMDSLIDAMLTLSQVSRQGMQLEEVDLTELVNETALHLQQQEPERTAAFVISPAMRVRGDRHLLKVALENLLENAWKYTRDAADPRIEVGSVEQEGKTLFFVRDNGAGFDMAEGEKLFQPFQRLQSAKGFPGSGIGLATVQRVFERHQGWVSGEGESGKGATFYFWIPE